MTGEQHKGATAVRAAKRPKLSEGQPWEKLDLFPTPPWATRALLEIVLPSLGIMHFGDIRDPCAGLGHMSDVLREYGDVDASDIFNYDLADGRNTRDLGIRQCDFLDSGGQDAVCDWVIGNPPFSPAADFLTRAMRLARVGIAFLLRMQWLEGVERYKIVYCDRPPVRVAQFVERVPMCEGGWDPAASTATAYAWFVWLRHGDSWQPKVRPNGLLDFALIPPGQRQLRAKPSDQQLATRFVPGWVPPSTLKKTGRDQLSLDVKEMIG